MNVCRLDRESHCKTVPLPRRGGEDEHFAVRETCPGRSGGRPCRGCGKPFVMHPTRGWKGTFQVVEVSSERVSIMRGDDVVVIHYFHPGCFRPEGVRP